MHLKYFTLLLSAAFLCWNAGCSRLRERAHESESESPSEAGASLQWWAMARSFPDGRFYTEKYAQAFEQMRLETLLRGERSNDWEAIGPRNIGGRTLCLAVNPLDTNIMWLGSASGGLWKTNSAGRGPNAWTRVETGFPVLGVSAVAIDPQNPDNMYIGTGEVYNLENSAPNVAFRTTRGTYGIGLLKSSDGGLHWTKSIDWSYGDMQGVQDIKINPLRQATVYAATSRGLMRSYDAGAHWQTVHDLPMAVDIEINPLDTNRIFVTHGSLDDEAYSGVFRSTDGGNNFVKMLNGLPDGYSGKTMLGMSPTQPDILYASVADAFTQIGLYKTENGGDSWVLVNNSDICSYQGWYSHDVAVRPGQPNQIIWTGVDLYKSTNGGEAITQKSYWYLWNFGEVPAGGPEGPYNYVHADIHRAYWQQSNPNKVYVVSDGGLFVSYDNGESWQGRNGGYQSQQFYADMGNSRTNPNLCIGGMQDNASAIYTGGTDWKRVLGGDGECAGIHPADDQIFYGSSQYLHISRSNDQGAVFFGINSQDMLNEEACFNGPFVFAPSNPDVMYAGGQSLHRSSDAGYTWENASNGYLANGDAILTIAVHPTDENIVYCSTAPLVTSHARVFRYSVSSGIAKEISGLPDRLCMDIVPHPTEPKTLYAVFAGFNTEHVWRSTDNGNSWTAIDNGLPDLPANSMLIDPLAPNHLYVGNDLGVWYSADAGASWSLYSGGAPQALPAMYLGITADRKLRVGTYGLGVWQTPLAEISGAGEPQIALSLNLAPNPAADHIRVAFENDTPLRLRTRIFDAGGREVRQTAARLWPAGAQNEQIDLSGLPAGTYGLVLEGSGLKTCRIFVKR